MTNGGIKRHVKKPFKDEQIVKNMYRLFPLRQLRRTAGVLFDEVVPSDIPVISGLTVRYTRRTACPPGRAKG